MILRTQTLEPGAQVAIMALPLVRYVSLGRSLYPTCFIVLICKIEEKMKQGYICKAFGEMPDA